MRTFYSPTSTQFTLVLKPWKINREGEVVQEGKKISFDGRYFTTNDDEVAEQLRNARSFGRNFIEITADTPAPAEKGLKFGVVSMDSVNPSKDEKVAELETQVKTLTDQVSKLISALSQAPTSVPEDKKVDKRSKEYKESLKEE